MTSNVMPDGWISLVAADSFDQISTLGKSVKTKDCSASGKYPVVDQGQELITGYIDDFSRVVEVENPIVLFGDHTRAVKWIDFSFVPGADGTKLLKPKLFINNRFSYYQLKSLDIPDKGYARHFKYLKELSFVIPPLAEQQVIADKLDNLLAQVESIKARLERIPEILKQFRQSVLAAAVSGKLTEEWRDINGLDGSYKIVENILFETPIAWSFHRLEQITSRVTYGLTKRPAYVSDGVAVISAKEIRTGFVNFEVASQISESDFDGLREKCKIFPGDLLFSKTGSIGHVAIYNAEFQSASSQNIAVITPLSNLVMCQFLYYYLRSPFIQELAQSSVKANAIPDLQLGIISKFPIQLPLLVEQKVIVEKVESIFSTIDGIEQQAKSALERVNNLTQSILAKAFRGELTAEWREANHELISGENSAEALLDRIKAERESVEPATKRGRGKA